MENYMQYHVMGTVSQVRMKPGCMPHKFICQPDGNTRTSDTMELPNLTKKRNGKKLKECKKEFKEKNIVTGQSSCEETESASEIEIEQDNNQMEDDNEKPTMNHIRKPGEIIGVRLKKAPKTAAERAREWRARRALLKQQSKQQQEPSKDNQVSGPSKIRKTDKRAKSAEATRRWRERKRSVNGSTKKQAKTTAQRMREYRKRKNTEKKILLMQQSDQDLINSQSQQHNISERTRKYHERRNDNMNIESDDYEDLLKKIMSPNDLEYHEMESCMKPRCMPNTFICQLDKKTRKSDTTELPFISKKQRMIFDKSKKDLKNKCIVTEQSSFEEIASDSSEDIRSADPSEDNQVPGPSKIRTKDKRVKPAKTTAQRMREYRKRKKIEKKILLNQQSDQDLDDIVSTSSLQVNQTAGPLTIYSISPELTGRGNSQSQQLIVTSEPTREYHERRNDNINIQSHNYEDLLKKIKLPNHMEHHVMGSCMKPGCMPNTFICQLDRKTQTSSITKQPYIAMTQRQSSFEENASGSSESRFIKIEPIGANSYVEIDVNDPLSVPESLQHVEIKIENKEVTETAGMCDIEYEETPCIKHEFEESETSISYPIYQIECEENPNIKLEVEKSETNICNQYENNDKECFKNLENYQNSLLVPIEHQQSVSGKLEKKTKKEQRKNGNERNEL